MSSHKQASAGGFALPTALLASSCLATAAWMWIAHANRIQGRRTKAVDLLISSSHYRFNSENVRLLERYLIPDILPFTAYVSGLMQKFLKYSLSLKGLIAGPAKQFICRTHGRVSFRWCWRCLADRAGCFQK
ncbi:hypothetical protein ACLEIY_10330 [Acetobacter tropicalis]|uniref:hypothetical protein n=1 Tax=Acetobacter tropicalis TaxID=104102 RepID=UPI003974F5F2